MENTGARLRDMEGMMSRSMSKENSGKKKEEKTHFKPYWVRIFQN